MLQEYDDYFLEEDKIIQNKDIDSLEEFVKLLDKPELEPMVLDNPVVEEKPFYSNTDLPDAELYFGGDKGETDAEHDLRMIYYSQREEMERLGMTVSSGHVIIKKDNSNMIGISIGGGGPYCPCLYIVQVFDGTPVAKEGTLQSGDELLGVNGVSVKGKTKVEVAKMIQSAENETTIHYNKLHADNEKGDTLDIAMKKIKHRLVENMSTRTADALGFSRAILCNDSLVKRLQELEGTELMYRGLVDHCKRVLKAYFNVFQSMQNFGTEFCEMSVREPQPRASEAYRSFGEMHRNLEKDGIIMIKALKPVIANFGTYLNKAIPDTKMTVRKYANAKFAYLSYCLKVKELDDEEQSYSSIQEPLYRVETGNYEYRLILRCRQDARIKFAKLRNDVLEKIELLEAKHAQNLADNLKRLLEGLAKFSVDSLEKFETTKNLFPIEVDLKDDAFEYKSNQNFSCDMTDEPEEEVIQAEEAQEVKKSEANGKKETLSDDLLNLMLPGTVNKSLFDSESTNDDAHAPIIPNMNRNLLSNESLLSDNGPISNPDTTLLSGFESFNIQPTTRSKTNEDLLTELGLDDIDLALSKNSESTTKNMSIDDLLN